MAHVVKDRDMIDKLHAQGADLCDHIFAVIDNMIRTISFNPSFRLRTGCGCDNRKSRLFGMLNTDGANTATCANDQDRFAFIGPVAINAEPIKECLICSYDRLRQGRRFGVVQRFWFVSSDACIHQMEFCIGA